MSTENKSVQKLFFLLIGFSLVLLLSLMLVEKFYSKENAQKVALHSAVDQTKERELVINDFLQNAKNYIFALRNSKDFNIFLENNSNTANINNIFLTFAKSNLDFMQIRYIDKSGKERLKAIREKEKSPPHLVPTNKLQNRADRYYFLNSKQKKLEEVWFSPIDLNENNGIIETPYKPTIRAILPIGNKGTFDGVLMINFFMSDFLAKLTNTPLYDMILYNNKGYTIYHYKAEKSWGDFQENKINISQDFPSKSKQILANDFLETSQFVSRKLNVEIANGLNIILQLKEKYLQEQESSTLKQYLTSASIIFFLSLILATLLVKIFSKTLLNLEKIRNLNAALNKFKTRNEVALKNSAIGIWEIDFANNFLSFDAQMNKIYDLETKDKTNLYSFWKNTLDKEYRQNVEDNLQNAIKNNGEYDICFWITTPKGNRKYIKAFGLNELTHHGIATKMIGINQDITKQMENEMLLMRKTQEQDILLSLFDKSDSVLFKWENKQGWPVNYVSSNVKRLFGYSKQEWLSLQITYAQCVHKDDLGHIVAEIENGIRNKTPFIAHDPYRIITKDGTIKWIHDQTVLDIDKNGNVVQLLGYVIDITEAQNAFLMLEKQSYTDELTKLNNRKAYNQKLQELYLQYKRYETIFSIALLDIDHFKSINDTYGHSQGDTTLKRLGGILTSTMRETDQAYRIGGEEFAILLTNTSKENAVIFAEKLRKKVGTELSNIEGKVITTSIGIAQINKNDTIETIFNRADKNLYHAKNSGRNQVIAHS